MFEELLNLFNVEARRNRSLASLTSEESIKSDYLHTAELFDRAADHLRAYEMLMSQHGDGEGAA